MRARSARKVWSAALATLVVLFTGVAPVQASVVLRRGLDSTARAQLASLRAAADRAGKAEAETAWLRLAVFALEHSPVIVDPRANEDPDVTKALREACESLPACSLAAVAAHGTHPMVSERFCAAVLRFLARHREARSTRLAGERRGRRRGAGRPVAVRRPDRPRTA